MTFLTITLDLEGKEIRVNTEPRLSVLAGVDPEIIGQCAVLSDRMMQATNMVMQHCGAQPDQPTINALGGESDDSEQSN